MDNKEIPNMNGTQNANNTWNSPQSFQQAPQPIQQQPIVQPMTNVPENNGQKTKKKTGIIIGASVGGVVVIALVAVLFFMFFGNKQKTVTCTTSESVFGVMISGETNIRIKDGKITGGDAIANVDLKNIDEIYRNHEKEMVEEITERFKKDCEEHCTFDYKYVEGDNAKYTMVYDEEGVDELVYARGIENMSSQEIANKVQGLLEKSNVVCSQK